MEIVNTHAIIDFAGVSPISHEHSWPVISAFFEKEGLVSQQLSSYNSFISNLKNIVSNSQTIELPPNRQFLVTDQDVLVRHTFSLFSDSPLIPMRLCWHHKYVTNISFSIEMCKNRVWVLGVRTPHDL